MSWPEAFSAGQHSPNLSVTPDRRTVHYTAQTNEDSFIRADKPVPIPGVVYYFEVTLDDAAGSCISVGFSDSRDSLGTQVGWERGYGYRGDDGKTYHKNVGQQYGPMFGSGDTIGAGLLIGKREIFFTRNGVRLGRAFTGVREPELYPSVGMSKRNQHVTINCGEHPFMFDLQGLNAVNAQHAQPAMPAVPSAAQAGGPVQVTVHVTSRGVKRAAAHA